MFNESFAHNDMDECRHTSKISAIIAVDEIIEAVIDASHKTSGSHEFWLEVKEELNKL